MFVHSAALAALPGIRHAFFTREGGVSDGIYASLNAGVGSSDDPARVQENRRRMAEYLGIRPEGLLSCYQIHSPDVLIAQGPFPSERPKADGVVTDRSGLACCAASADCGPVLFADAQAKVVGAAHAGWKGALGGVLETAITRMEERGAQRQRIVAAIGPLIRQPSYEVSAAFVATFTALDPSYQRFFVEGARPGHAQFDLPGFIAHRLRAAGIGTVDDLGLDTYSDAARFYSYRRTTHRNEPDYGRHIAAICLMDGPAPSW